VRELRGLGVPDVVLVYRGDESGMSGYRHEWEGARKLGVRAAFRRQPVAFASDEGAVTGLRLAPLGPDKRPLGVDPELLPAQLVLLAIGQGTLGHLVEGLDGVQTARGRVVADAAGRTGNPRVFVGGDCKNGGKEVVNAVAEGRDAAVAIDELLRRAGAEVA
jgi:dihydropyrimidine dehydrogenase (NAD+) subunit PreT